MKNKKVLAIDAYYYGKNDCYTVGIIFNDFKSSEAEKEFSTHIRKFAKYIPGSFWKRELPGILSIIRKVNMDEIGTILIDGYCWLNDNNSQTPRKGIGEVLYETIRTRFPDIHVIGIAKSLFGVYSSDIYTRVMRGKSIRPLYVTIAGNNNVAERKKTASKLIHMKGRCRIPDLLGFLDKETKKYKSSRINLKDGKEICKKRKSCNFKNQVR